jgi:hypothetical protein
MEDGSAVKVVIKGTGLEIIAIAPMIRLGAREVIKNWARWTRSEMEGGADRRQGRRIGRTGIKRLSGL